MTPFRSLSVLALGLLAAHAAYAQWSVSAGAGLQHTALTEYDPGGRELVREHGWMPGIEVRAGYAWRAWRFGIAGSTYRAGIAYDGHLQSGAPFSTDTDATQDRFGIDAAWRLTDTVALIGGIEWEHRRRSISGRTSARGLDERSTSWRLLAGSQWRLAHLAGADIDAKGLLVFARAERLRVRFDQRFFDDVSLSTKPAVGLRAALTATPESMPRLSATVEFDWMKVRRSDDTALTRNGVQQGAVTQPAHQRRTLGLFLAYRFD